MSNEIKFTKFTIEPDDVDSRFLAVHVERDSEHRQYYMVGRYFYVLLLKDIYDMDFIVSSYMNTADSKDIQDGLCYLPPFNTFYLPYEIKEELDETNTVEYYSPANLKPVRINLFKEDEIDIRYNEMYFISANAFHFLKRTYL